MEYGLHKKAGIKNVIEIHGNLEYVYFPTGEKRLVIQQWKDQFIVAHAMRCLNPNIVLYGAGPHYGAGQTSQKGSIP